MITIYCSERDRYVAGLVRFSFIRSFTTAQVNESLHEDHVIDSLAKVHVFINPCDKDVDCIRMISRGEKNKIILLGALTDNVAQLIGISVEELPSNVSIWDETPPAEIYGFSESSGKIRYKELPASLECPIQNRPLLRYDFACEWNNLGYGHVKTDKSIWSVSQRAKFVSNESKVLAEIYQNEEIVSLYSTLNDMETSSILWVNRSVGLIDTHEFRLIETYITNFRANDLACLPLLREVPFGYDAMVTMRLDCDEDIASARPLFECYKEMGIPFSFAVKTALPASEDNISLLTDVLNNNGAVLSHTMNHKPNWGDDLDDVISEARASRDWLIENVPELENIDYAVSPFHQNPDYAVEGLEKANFKGFVSGIICNDPQYLMARAGHLYGDAINIVSHSQQCMLHGDCVLKSEVDQLKNYKKSAEYTINSKAIFGYLDHPFSERYQYGWDTEEQRMQVHKDWISYLKAKGDVLFENEENTLNHIVNKSKAKLWLDDEVVKYDEYGVDTDYILAYEFRGMVYKVQ